MVKMCSLPTALEDTDLAVVATTLQGKLVQYEGLLKTPVSLLARALDPRIRFNVTDDTEILQDHVVLPKDSTNSTTGPNGTNNIGAVPERSTFMR